MITGPYTKVLPDYTREFWIQIQSGLGKIWRAVLHNTKSPNHRFPTQGHVFGAILSQMYCWTHTIPFLYNKWLGFIWYVNFLAVQEKEKTKTSGRHKHFTRSNTKNKTNTLHCISMITLLIWMFVFGNPSLTLCLLFCVLSYTLVTCGKYVLVIANARG